MAYLGNELRVSYPSYQIIDSISGSFDGTTTAFALKIGGIAPSPLPMNAQQLLISVGGVQQQPDPSGANGFSLSGGNIVFSSAPAVGEKFWGVMLAGVDRVTPTLNYPNGSVTAPSITFTNDASTGAYLPTAGTLGLTAGGILGISLNSSGNVTVTNNLTAAGILASGSISTGAITATGNVSTKDINATGNISATGTITATSDIKFKTNVKTLTDALSKVSQLRGVEYDRIDTAEHQIGVIAQEVEQVIPEVVKDNDGIKSVAYGNLVGLLIEAVKEQQKEIEILKLNLK